MTSPEYIDDDAALDCILYGTDSETEEPQSQTPAPVNPPNPVPSPPVDPNLVQCQGPCSRKYYADSIIRCGAGHPFCLDDARNYTATKLGTGARVLNCMNFDCDQIFPGTEVLRYIDLKVFAGLPRERLEIMIDAVGVRGLVEICPYCNAVNNTGPLSQTSVTACFNCEKKSCRECHKRAHGPKECEEAQKDSLECGHCFKEYPPEEIARCEDGHPFCFPAVKEYVADQLGKGIPVLQCLQPGCGKIFPGVEVLRFIDLKIFAGQPKERLEIMIDKVGVRGLVELCPNCVTAVACGPVEDNSAFICTNPSCGESHCRKCQKEIHSPLTCELYGDRLRANQNHSDPESSSQVGSPTAGLDLSASFNKALKDIITDEVQRIPFQIEAMLTDAILRRCNSCLTQILKQKGCNLLTCDACGNRQCYTCSDDVTGVDHFDCTYAEAATCHLYDQEAFEAGDRDEPAWGTAISGSARILYYNKQTAACKLCSSASTEGILPSFRPNKAKVVDQQTDTPTDLFVPATIRIPAGGAGFLSRKWR